MSLEIDRKGAMNMKIDWDWTIFARTTYCVSMEPCARSGIIIASYNILRARSVVFAVDS